MKKKAVPDYLFCSILISFSLSFLLFLYGPSQIYISNVLDFNFSFFDVWLYMLPVGLLLTVLGMLLLIGVSGFNREAGMFLMCISTGLLLALFVEGNFLANTLPVLDGNQINWENYNGSRIISLIIWIICISGSVLLFCFLADKRLQAIKWICIIGLLFLILSLAVSLVTDKNALNKKSDATMTADGMLDMSKEKNFVIFLLDSVDEKSFESVLDNKPEYKNVFRDFTSFSNTLCMYPFTDRSVPFILFGKWNDNSEYYPDYLEGAIKESPFFEELIKKGFEQRVYFESLQGISISEQKFGNFVTAEKIKDPAKFCKMLIKLSGFRNLPFDLKRFCVLTPENIYFDSLKTSSDNSLDLYSYNNADLYRRIQNSEIEYKNEKSFRFIYASGAHAPYIYDKDLNEIPDGTYSEAIEASIKLVGTYIEKLKNAGVYDNTVIVVMADHGINTANYLGREGRQNPIMLIKGIGENHDYYRNDAPVSHADLQEAFIKLLNGKKAEEAFDWKEGDTRIRTYMLSDSGSWTELTEYKTEEHASITGALYATGQVYPYEGNT